MSLSYLKVVRVMTRCDFYNTGTKFHIDIIVLYNRNGFIDDWEPYFTAVKVCITLIVRINCNGCIAEHCLRTCRCEFQKLSRRRLSVLINEWIFDMPEMSGLIFILNLCIGNGCITNRTPVDNTGALINPAFFMHLTKHFGYGFVTAFIHCKTLSVPVTAGT